VGVMRRRWLGEAGPDLATRGGADRPGRVTRGACVTTV